MQNPETVFLLRQWFNGGGSVVPLLERMIEEGEEPGFVAVVGRLALQDPECTERDEVVAILDRLTSAPQGCGAALERFAAAPSEEGWEELLRFVPEEVFYQRLKVTIPLLLRLGCDGDVLFRCVSRLGMMPELFDLAWSGSVLPDTIVARASGSPAAGAWLGLAAIASFARGDRTAAVRHLWSAVQADPVLALPAVYELRGRADAQFNEALDAAGVPGADSSP